MIETIPAALISAAASLAGIYGLDSTFEERPQNLTMGRPSTTTSSKTAGGMTISSATAEAHSTEEPRVVAPQEACKAVRDRPSRARSLRRPGWRRRFSVGRSLRRFESQPAGLWLEIGPILVFPGGFSSYGWYLVRL